VTLAPKIWLITGCSSGFGFSLARHALKNGQKVIVTSRNPSKTPELVEEIRSLGGEWIAFDVTASSGDIREKVREAESFFGDVDVLVNNAGYSVLGSLEDIELVFCIICIIYFYRSVLGDEAAVSSTIC
jgi:NAD(P)-dependent dehydrogenase (short-subunit alcohol dehydrogenase family)